MTRLGRLELSPALDRPDLLADPVAAALRTLAGGQAVLVAAIDPELSDTVAFSEAYDVPLSVSANCVLVSGRRGGEERVAACVVLATTRADVNGVVKRTLDVRKASFLPMTDAVERARMEHGGITAIGLPDYWALLIDTAVADQDRVVIGSGVRRSKLVTPGSLLRHLPNGIIMHLGMPTEH